MFKSRITSQSTYADTDYGVLWCTRPHFKPQNILLLASSCILQVKCGTLCDQYEQLA